MYGRQERSYLHDFICNNALNYIRRKSLALIEKSKDQLHKYRCHKGISLSTDDLLRFFNNYYTNVNSLHLEFIQRRKPVFFIRGDDQRFYVDKFREAYPESIDNIVDKAEETCNHIFDLLGSGPVNLGEHIDWSLDFKTGHHWPLSYYKEISYKNWKLKSDIKVPVELSRFLHATILGKAYWLTGEEKYAKEYIDQLTEWIAKNPVGLGVNWFCAMDVAIRAVNWIWGFYFCRNSQYLDKEFLVSFLKSLILHGRHIYDNLENKGNMTTNHYIADLVGLIYLGIFFKKSSEAQSWYSFARDEILRELNKQIYTDGGDYEHSTCYHRFVLEMFYSAALLCRLNEDEWPGWAWQKIHKMFLFISGIVKPDGRIPQIGDNDSGRLHKLQLSEDELDVKYLFPIGAALFEDPNLKFNETSYSEEALWLLGVRASESYRALDCAASLNDLPSVAFRESGLYVIRDKKFYCIISARAQEKGGGHAHNDQFSFELQNHGSDIIVDPGTFIYSGDKDKRNLYRSTRMHNVTMIDEMEINEFDENKLFQLINQRKIEAISFSSSSDSTLFQGSMIFGTESEPIKYARTFIHHNSSDTLIIRDHINSPTTQEHHFISFLHFAPEIEISTQSDHHSQQFVSLNNDFSDFQHRYTFQTNKCKVVIQSQNPLLVVHEKGTVSPSYGSEVQAEFTAIKNCAQSNSTVIRMVIY